MSWSDWARLGLVALAAGGCGFRPMYAPTPQLASLPQEAAGEPSAADGVASGDLSRRLAAISVAPIAERTGQLLRNTLTEMLHAGGGAPARYTLAVTLKEERSESAIDRAGLATRATVYAAATFRLTSIASGSVLLGDSAVALVSYNLLDDDYATLIAEQDANARLARRLALDIRNRLGAYFRKAGTEPAARGPGVESPGIDPEAPRVPVFPRLPEPLQ